MELHLSGTPDWTKAKNIYESGGNSGGYAEITLATALAAAHLSGVTVTQTGTSATGTLKSDAALGATTIKVAYTSACKQGGSDAQDLSGCFSSTAAITVDSSNVGNPTGLTNKYRTLQGFSTKAEGKMKMQETYQVYKAYYGDYDYANDYVLEALNGNGAFFGKDDVARVEGAKKASAYMNVWMYVIHEIEDAIMDCESGCIACNDDPVHAIDEAAVFYAGSLEGSSVLGQPDLGKLVFRLAEKRCADFGTCTGSGNQAAVNEQIVQKLQLAQNALVQSRCVDVVPLKKRIVELMSIPLVQGSLRYAYKVDQISTSGIKERAEGAVFAAAILPRVAACDPNAAQIISDNMKINAASPMAAGFVAIKTAFESTYACLGITCEDIGGLILSGSQYYDLAAPCVTQSPVTQTITETRIPGWAIAVIIVIGVTLLVACAVAAVFFNKANTYKTMSRAKASGEVGFSLSGQPVGQSQDAAA